MVLVMTIVGNQSEHTRHASLGLVLRRKFILWRWIVLLLLPVLYKQDAFKKPATMGAVDHIKSQTTSGAEIQYKWLNKLCKDNYFATYTLLIIHSFILQLSYYILLA